MSNASRRSLAGGGWRLRELCRRRLLGEMIGKAVQDNGGGSLVLVTDASTQLLVQSLCRLSDLSEAKVTVVERIDAPRVALPNLTALYFLTPSDAAAEHLLTELSESGPRYAGKHVFFSHQPSPELLQRLAVGIPDIEERLRSFGELNLGFLPYDDRAFHLGDGGSALLSVLGGIPPEAAALAEVACRLATLPALLGVRPRVRYAASAAAGYVGSGFSGGNVRHGVCERLATEVQARIEELEARGATWADDAAPTGGSFPGGCDLLIVDRSFDWAPLLVHDMHFEALAFDLLADGAAVVQDGRFERRALEGAPDAQGEGAPDELLWREYRHLPYWRVADQLKEKTEAFGDRDKEMRQPANATQGQASARHVSQQVANTLDTLQGLQEHRQLFRSLEATQGVFLGCQASEQLLLLAVPLEQDLAAGVAADGAVGGLSGSSPALGGAPCAPRRWWCHERTSGAMRELVRLLEDPRLPHDAKLRLLLLYFASDEGLLCSQADRAELAAHLPRADAELGQLLGGHWAEVRPPGVRRLADQQRRRCRQALRAHRGTSPSPAFSRWEPRLRALLEDVAAGSLDAHDFPEVLPAPSTTPASQVTVGGTFRLRAAASERSGARALIVFVIGGVTMPEARVVHEASRSLGVEAFVGGSCILTPAAFLDLLRDNR